MNFLKNIAVNLTATGPATVMIVWVICVTLIGLYGSGDMAARAMLMLSIFGGAVLISLASKM